MLYRAACVSISFPPFQKRNECCLSVTTSGYEKSLIFGAKFKSRTPLKCVNFPPYLRRPIHTQTRCLSAQHVLCDSLRHGVAAVLGNHRAAHGRQRVFGISPPACCSYKQVQLVWPEPKKPLTLFTSAILESLLLGLLRRISVDFLLLLLTRRLQA